MAPIFKEFWPFHQSWLDYVVREWAGPGRVHLVNTDHLERIEFMEAATQAFLKQGIPVRHCKTYLSIQVPSVGSGYAEHYPHIHYPLDATTLIHYLQPGDKPAPLDIFDGDEVIETIHPEQGLTVFVPNHVKHGVRLNQGTTNRIQLIATALR